MKPQAALYSAIIACSLVLTACGTPGQGASQSQNPPFKNELQSEKVVPGKSFNPTPASSSVYQNITVTASDGKQVVLHPKDQPILIEASWCPHCQRTLVMLDKYQKELKQLPIVVSTGFAQGTSLADAIKISNQERQALHLQNYKEYYLLNPVTAKQLVPQGFPTMVFPYQGQLMTLMGEHDISVWKKALNG